MGAPAMPKKLTPEHIDAMQSARKVTSQQRKAAYDALAGNPQFTNPKFWRRVDVALLDEIRSAIDRAVLAAKEAQLRKLEEELEVLRSR